MSKFLEKMTTSVAHTSKIPMLGPKDLRLLGNIITTEKGVMTAATHLAGETRKASEAIRDWGKGEGDDLGDILGKVSLLFDQLSAAEMKYAEYNATFRQYFKAVRTREESLISLKKTRDGVTSRIETLEKKMSKMNPEHKDLPSLQVRLRDTRAELNGLDHAVMNEEARLGDFKRDTVREAMALKLGALLEWSERSTIIAELGKLLLDEIPRERTEPGGTRAIYRGWNRTDEILDEAKKCLNEVTFNPMSSDQGRLEEPERRSSAAENQHTEHHQPRQFSEPPINNTEWEVVPNQPSQPPAPQELENGHGNHNKQQHMGMHVGVDHDQHSANSIPPIAAKFQSQSPPPSQPPVLHTNGEMSYQVNNNRMSIYRDMGYSDLPYSRPLASQAVSGYNPDLDSQYPQYKKPEETSEIQRPYAPRIPQVPIGENDASASYPVSQSPSRRGFQVVSRRDSALGSKYGYDMSTAPTGNDYRNMSYDPYNSSRSEMGYAPTGYNRPPAEVVSLGVGEGRKMPASAFMRKPNAPVYSSPNPVPSGPTPAERIKEEWRKMSYSGPPMNPSASLDTTMIYTEDGESVQSPVTTPLQIKKKNSSLPVLPPDENHGGYPGTSTRVSHDLPALPYQHPPSLHSGDSLSMSQSPRLQSSQIELASPLRMVPVTRLD